MQSNFSWKALCRWAFVLFCFTYGLIESYQFMVGLQGDVTQGDMADTPQIYYRLAALPSITDTFKFFVGPMVTAPETKFYRPLPCMLWWIIIHSPLNSLTGLMAVHWATHLAVCIVAVLFFRHLFGWNLAALGVGIWAAGIGEYLGLPSAYGALFMWKDNIDTWYTLLALLLMWSVLSAIRTEKKVFWAAAIGLQFVGIFLKESTYALPSFVLLLLWNEGKLKQAWRWVLPFGAIVAMAVVLRTWALQGSGTHLGTNGSWLPRFLGFAGGGRPLIVLMALDFVPLAVVTLLGAALAVRRSWKWAAGLALAGVGLMLLTDVTIGTEAWGESASRLALIGDLKHRTLLLAIVQTLVLVCFYCYHWRHRSEVSRRAYLFFLVPYLPLFYMVVQSHGLYLPAFGWGLLFAMPVWHAFRASPVYRRLQQSQVKLGSEANLGHLSGVPAQESRRSTVLQRLRNPAGG